MKIAFSGLSGRMGQAFKSCISDMPQHVLIFGLGRTSQDGPPPIYTSFSQATENVEVLVDFSSPEFILSVLHECPSTVRIVLSGTTGFTSAQMNELKSCAKNKFLFHANNFSIGVLALIKSIQSVGALLRSWDTHLTEVHHVHKKDAPSGTAKWMLQTLKDAGGHPSPEVESRREGETTGEHEIRFSQPFESLTLKHVATSSHVFARGVLTILDWIQTENRHHSPGFYTMEDYFNSVTS